MPFGRRPGSLPGFSLFEVLTDDMASRLAKLRGAEEPDHLGGGGGGAVGGGQAWHICYDSRSCPLGCKIHCLAILQYQYRAQNIELKVIAGIL